MNNDKLHLALQPVLRYFSGREVNENTILAAYLRARGLPASGQPWEAAKSAMRRGADFEEAVLAAATRPSGGVVPALLSMSEEPAPFHGNTLEWFAKQFGPGDIDGEGALRLLGTPNIERASILVRETSQNSWDARGVSASIDFVMNLRLLRTHEVELLRTRVFRDDPPKIGLGDLLNGDEVWALEIADRGTVGLGGPIRNDLEVDGVDTNFIDLVFNIGAPRDVHLGGGTYGFGKTISYLVSGVGTVLIWSRCEGSRGLEHRLIGSAIGDSFPMGGLRYTGRHWWGNVIVDENRVEPVTGRLAKELGEAVFTTAFGGDTTGTSLLILDPRIGGGSPEEDVKLLAEAAVCNLWPKLLADQSDRSRMNISIQLNGNPVGLPSIEQDPVLSGHAECLLAVRAAELGTDPEALPLKFRVRVQEIWLKQPKTLLGHLALTRYPTSPQVASPSHSVTLMRQAELVVREFQRHELSIEGFQWAGVFKPVSAVDDSFALAEPPAHDDWVPQSVPDPKRRREVNVALRRIKEFADDYLSPRPSSLVGQDALPSAAHVGDMLRDLLGGLDGPGPDSRGASQAPDGHSRLGDTGRPAGGAGISSAGGTGQLDGKSPARSRGRPKVEVVSVVHEPGLIPDWTRTTLHVRLADGSAVGATVDVTVSVGIEGGSWKEDSDDVLRVVGWMNHSGDAYNLRPREFRPGDHGCFVYESRSDLAIDIRTKLVDA